ncbi:MAG: RdgB/HAM1 family non-canonical purine NTP pyrophosphatase [Methylococcaceae bacterium]|nr:RdgB/HAM1 family non-canonical purine NTP pyrophosphatase [Methylococcaceae bacterium]MCI0668347.1 RdgB/HAM1 family non-canonical purine NTP pyrophosphatase [Methylococcaceae bacterium]MCI0733137.1 RdgB/HAM1 family non-canonical purine NTP pyrophosphatase [Methylococcaceae bacterium]
MFEPIVLASNNPGKIKEIQAIFRRYRIIPQSDFGVPEVEENGTTFAENALIKARNAARCSNLPAIADDSGIEVDALNGAPGVHSARYAGSGANDQQNLEKLLDKMKPVADGHRGARFRCVIVYIKHAGDPCPLIAEGVWEGEVLRAPRGMNGFGYDPVFWVPGFGCSSAELAAQEKNRISHRAIALNKLAERLAALQS